MRERRSYVVPYIECPVTVRRQLRVEGKFNFSDLQADIYLLIQSLNSKFLIDLKPIMLCYIRDRVLRLQDQYLGR